jgi:hypothetical protein
MINPFPGMDPYLEGPHWPDFHDRLINSLSETIAEELPPNYDTEIRDRVYPVREPYIEIYSLPDREVIAVVEILSPTNNSGRGRVEYLDKRDEVLRAPVHLVEIDLLLAGSRVPLGAALPPGDYSESDRQWVVETALTAVERNS